MRVFEWENGFTPYGAALIGDTLTEYQGETIERVSRVVRRQEWDGHAGREDFAMTDDFSAGDVDGVAVAWIDGHAFELVAPSEVAPSVEVAPIAGESARVSLTACAGHVSVTVTGADGATVTARVDVASFADASAFVTIEAGDL